jgi:outer membrane biosynthesis protein TonB
MNRISTESKISFFGTIIFHSLLLLMALFMSLNNKPQPIEFVELSFTAIEMPAIKAPARTAEPVVNRQQPITDVQPRQAGPAVTKPTTGTTSNNNAQTTTTTTVPQIAHPRSTLSMDSDPQSIRLQGSKLDVSDTREHSSSDRSSSSSSNQEKSNFSRDNNSEALPNSGGSVSSGISLPGNSNVGKEIQGFSISWQDGGIRNKTSGSMPKYPENSNKEVQIKVQVTVAPDGSITKIVPLQKADYAFENSVNVALRTWKFEKLRQGVPEEPQTGIITFNFKLE